MGQRRAYSAIDRQLADRNQMWTAEDKSSMHILRDSRILRSDNSGKSERLIVIGKPPLSLIWNISTAFWSLPYSVLGYAFISTLAQVSKPPGVSEGMSGLLSSYPVS